MQKLGANISLSLGSETTYVGPRKHQSLLPTGQITCRWARQDQSQDKLQDVKAKTKCFNCGEVGYWAGDSACRRGTDKGKHRKDRRPTRWLPLTSLAAATLLATTDGVECFSLQHTESVPCHEDLQSSTLAASAGSHALDEFRRTSM